MTMHDALSLQSSSFYVAGGTLRRDAPSYVVRKADTDLLDGLRAGQFCYVLDTRQMGKSSLMVRTAERLRAAGVTVAILDLTQVGQDLSREQWYYGLLRMLDRQIDQLTPLVAFWKENRDLGPLQRWMSAIQHVLLPTLTPVPSPNHSDTRVGEGNKIAPFLPGLGEGAGDEGGRLVIFVDEIDTVRSLPFSIDEFFVGIREAYNRRVEEPQLEQITFCLLGVATPADLIQDARTTPFNIGHRVVMNDFTLLEAEPLAQALGSSERDGEKLLKRILYWTGGHPYLTQRLCQAVAEDGSVRSAIDVDRICEAIFLSRTAREVDDNLAFVRNRLLKSEADVASVLDLYAQMRVRHRRVKDDPANPLLSILRLSGIVRVVGGFLWVRNRIYHRVFDKEWILANMPDADRRRQRSAFRRGALRAAALSSVIFTLMVVLIVRERQQAHQARQREREALHLLYVADINVAQQALERHNVAQVLELLALHRSEASRRFVWGYLMRQCSQARLTYKSHAGVLYAIAFAPDGKILATGGEDGTLEFWDTTNGTCVRRITVSAQSIRSIAFSAHGRWFATGSDDATVKVWETASGRCVRTLTCGKRPIVGVAFSTDGSRLAAGSQDGHVCIWQAPFGAPSIAFTAPTGVMLSIAYTSDGRRLATAGVDGTVRLWDAKTGRLSGSLPGHSDAVYTVAFSTDAKWLAAGNADATTSLWDLRTGHLIHTLSDRTQAITALAFSPDGNRLATGSEDNAVILWDVASGRKLRSLDGHTHAVASAAFSADGRRLATGSWDGSAKIWDVTAGPETMPHHVAVSPLTVFCYSSDGERLAGVEVNNRVTIWNAATGAVLSTWHVEGSQLGMAAFCMRDRCLVVDNSAGEVRAYDATTGRNLGLLMRLQRPFHFVGVSPDRHRRIETKGRSAITCGGCWSRCRGMRRCWRSCAACCAAGRAPRRKASTGCAARASSPAARRVMLICAASSTLPTWSDT